MQEKMKKYLSQAEAAYNKWTATKWYRRLNITTGVFWNLAVLLAIILVTGGVFAASVGAGYFASLVDEEKLRSPDEMRTEIYSYEETSEMFFDNEVYIGKVSTDLERKETSLDKVSKVAVDAVLATEDEYFNDHDGIVPKAIMRGLFQDVSNSDSQTGGSTLTQQLIKNQILTNEVSYERKAKEILLALRLEKFMTKDEIMEAYLNIIPYGRNSSGANIAGIETAANGLFNVSASELNLPQAAFIAGIPKAPFRYTPYSSGGGLKEAEGLQPGIDRMKTVLYRMKETNYITEAEYNEAIAYDIVKDFRLDEQRSYEKYPFVTVELEKRAARIIMDVLAEQNGIDPKELEENNKLYEEYAILADRAVRSNGYRIHSSLNKEMYDAQEKAKNAYQSYGTTLTVPITNEDGEEEMKPLPVQVGSMTIENKTGRILSFVGGRDHEIEKLNHATQAYRSIGSTVKPLLVYGPALEFGSIGAGSPVVDVKFTVMDNGTPYEPANFVPTSEQGIMPARDALAQSQNLPALRLYAQIKEKMPINYLMKAGFSTVEEAENYNASAALGGGIEGSVEELTSGYATLANGGKRIEPHMIDRIEDADGNIVFERKVEPSEIYSPQTAYILTDMLRDVFNNDRGTANRANGLLKFNSDFAGKTGTTQETRDVWLVGYNPNITMSVWLGYDKEKYSLDNFKNSNLMPSVRVNQLWASLANSSYDANPELVGTKDTFKAPKGVVTRSFCGISGLAPGGACSAAGLVESDLFNANVMVPSKPDDSLTSGTYTTINGSRVAALPSTPSEFVSGGGTGVSKDFVERMLAPFGGDGSKLFPGNSRFSSVVSATSITPNGVAPSGVSASIDGRTITWSDSSSNDVVGYRIYRSGGSSIASISEARGNSYQLPSPGSYIVVAVDITGKQSGPSNAVSIAEPKPEPKPEPEKPEETTPPSSGTPPPPEEEPDEPAEPDEPEPEPEEPEEPETDEPEEPEEPEDPEADAA
ncbi:transglycosylase domain-containing protein [Planococcus sp. FY231025]|uniref:transglycosylase domain-containing protein n=1 Tax=Planococcus sp. FY231025 TaxID=3455699 RepID=UPI003F926350